MDTYGLIGHPLSHSFSQAFFRDKFNAEGLQAEYLNFDIPDPHDVLEVLAAHPTLRGFNVTIPYKERIIPYLDEMSKEAQAIGAVNVVRVAGQGKQRKLQGYNSDVVGFAQSIKPLLRPHHQQALILGTGGASKAVRYALEQRLGLKAQLVSRTPKPHAIVYAQLDAAALDQYTVIVNTTPLGMSPNIDTCPPLPYRFISPRHLLFDLVYNPEQTLFLKKGAEQGAETKNGLEMLLLQAIESWRIWQS